MCRHFHEVQESMETKTTLMVPAVIFSTIFCLISIGGMQARGTLAIRKVERPVHHFGPGTFAMNGRKSGPMNSVEWRTALG
jgi:hypothetical protein